MSSQDLSRFTITPPSIDEKKKKIVFTPFISSDEGKKPFIQYFTTNPLWIGVYAVLLFAAVASSVYLFRTDGSLEETTSPAAPMVTIIQEYLPTPTSAEEPVDISSFSITVLNGSGIAGEAGRAKSLLEAGGFTVINTGNSDRYDYTNTVIQAKQDVPDEVLRKLRSVLETEYELSDIQKLPDNEDAHIIVVIGDTKNR